jgi:hypothetical protein
VYFNPVRGDPRAQPRSPRACGKHPYDVTGGGVFFALRRITGWKGPPRTAVWGFAGTDIARVEVLGPHPGEVRRLQRREVKGPHGKVLGKEGPLLAVYGPHVGPDSLAVRVTRRDGTTRTYHSDTNLIKPPKRSRP